MSALDYKRTFFLCPLLNDQNTSSSQLGLLLKFRENTMRFLTTLCMEYVSTCSRKYQTISNFSDK